MKRPSYRAAIFWLTRNDDMSEIRRNPNTPWLVTECMVADLFDVATEIVRQEVVRELTRMDKAAA